MSNTTSTATKKFTLDQVFALWKKKSKDGKTTYFTGKLGNQYLTAFYVTKKKNLKEPDMKVYTRDENGDRSKEPIVSLWCNATKNGKKILSGKMDGKRVVGFINTNGNEKAPYISVYWSDESKAPQKDEKPATKKEEKNPVMEQKTIDDDQDLPF